MFKAQRTPHHTMPLTELTLRRAYHPEYWVVRNRRRHLGPCVACFLAFVLLSHVFPTRADYVEWSDGKGTHAAEGEVLAQTSAELLMLLPDGQMLLIPTGSVRALRIDNEPLRPLSPMELSKRLQEEFGPAFSTLITAHFVVVYDTDPPFANAVARLLEQLYGGFTRYFSIRGFEVKPSKFPLVAVLFKNRNEFVAYARRELDYVDERINGFYSMETNRLALYYVPPQRGFSRSLVSPQNVSTIAHEGAHQLTFNVGFLRRFSDPPLWILEGIATFFEVPAGASGRWSGAGQLNRARLVQFLDYVQSRRPPNSLRSLITTDERLQAFEQAVDAYAEAWALTYFLVRTRPRAFFSYLQHLGTKPYLHQSSPEERILEFEHYFGPIDEVDKQLVSYMRRLARFR